jgi:hypothetical protein
MVSGSGAAAEKLLTEEPKQLAWKGVLSEQRSTMMADEYSKQIFQRSSEHAAALMEFELVTLKLQFIQTTLQSIPRALLLLPVALHLRMRVPDLLRTLPPRLFNPRVSKGRHVRAYGAAHGLQGVVFCWPRFASSLRAPRRRGATLSVRRRSAAV